MFKHTFLLVFLIALSSCASQNQPLFSSNQTGDTDPVEKPNDSNKLKQLAKTEFDRLADLEIRQNTESLQTLMLKLYRRNPNELKKSGFASTEKMMHFLFERGHEHHYQFSALDNLQGKDAIFLAFDDDYQGDRIFALMSGLYTMMLKAHGGNREFYLLDELEAQKIYNFARNIEIAVWKLSNATNAKGEPYIISNSLSGTQKNISMEREFGKMIGRTDLFATAIAEKSERTITRMIQNIATAIFLPI